MDGWWEEPEAGGREGASKLLVWKKTGGRRSAGPGVGAYGAVRWGRGSGRRLEPMDGSRKRLVWPGSPCVMRVSTALVATPCCAARVVVVTPHHHYPGRAVTSLSL